MHRAATESSRRVSPAWRAAAQARDRVSVAAVVRASVPALVPVSELALEWGPAQGTGQVWGRALAPVPALESGRAPEQEWAPGPEQAPRPRVEQHRPGGPQREARSGAPLLDLRRRGRERLHHPCQLTAKPAPRQPTSR